MTLPRKISIACIATLAICSSPAWATMLTLQLDTGFKGATPWGTVPYTEIFFDDGGGVGSVALRIDNTGLTADEHVYKLYLNLNASEADILAMSVSLESRGPGDSFTYPIIEHEKNNFAGDDSGLYDIIMTFANIDSGTPGADVQNFGAAEEYFLTMSMPGMTANSFVSKSTPGGTHGPYYGAALIEDIGCDFCPGWIAPTGTDFPEPATLLMLSIGGVGMLRRRRR